jgi:hypothetical protein
MTYSILEKELNIKKEINTYLQEATQKDAWRLMQSLGELYNEYWSPKRGKRVSEFKRGL